MIVTLSQNERMAKKKNTTPKRASRLEEVTGEELSALCEDMAERTGQLQRLAQDVSESGKTLTVYGAGFKKRGLEEIDKYIMAVRKAMIDAGFE